ncbi:uncharacterized protein BXZ73DRAFT_79081 [Epithele typhae]|uniref:uncharacterized protein n=1 Tax=Epithele typhae TaxID=378194 RepID=UPI0020080682|nr:uncharacterized protein BXZ73DRAFT_79081 [Epithele typhae]KAH9925432.1 hypothetical protein BXZ73DRAFT_79081 [Epithele typhae]
MSLSTVETETRLTSYAGADFEFYHVVSEFQGRGDAYTARLGGVSASPSLIIYQPPLLSHTSLTPRRAPPKSDVPGVSSYIPLSIDPVLVRRHFGRVRMHPVIRDARPWRRASLGGKDASSRGCAARRLSPSFLLPPPPPPRSAQADDSDYTVSPTFPPPKSPDFDLDPALHPPSRLHSQQTPHEDVNTDVLNTEIGIWGCGDVPQHILAEDVAPDVLSRAARPRHPPPRRPPPPPRPAPPAHAAHPRRPPPPCPSQPVPAAFLCPCQPPPPHRPPPPASPRSSTPRSSVPRSPRTFLRLHAALLLVALLHPRPSSTQPSSARVLPSARAPPSACVALHPPPPPDVALPRLALIRSRFPPPPRLSSPVSPVCAARSRCPRRPRPRPRPFHPASPAFTLPTARVALLRVTRLRPRRQSPSLRHPPPRVAHLRPRHPAPPPLRLALHIALLHLSLRVVAGL